MLRILWEYRVREEKRAEFERRYARTGDWAALFQKSPAYRGTTLLRDLADPGRYLTLDAWDDDASFHKFKQDFAAQYDALDRTCAALTEEERCLGHFASVG